MSKQDVTGLAAPEVFTAAQLEAARNDGHAAGLAIGMAEGAKLERERIQSVEAQMLPGHESLIAAMKYDGKTSGPEAAVAVLAAERAKMADKRSAFSADAQSPLVFAAAPADERGASAAIAESQLSIEDRTKAEWDRDASLRSDFGGEYSRYLAYTKATELGLVKIYHGKGE